MSCAVLLSVRGARRAGGQGVRAAPQLGQVGCWPAGSRAGPAGEVSSAGGSPKPSNPVGSAVSPNISSLVTGMAQRAIQSISVRKHSAGFQQGGETRLD